MHSPAMLSGMLPELQRLCLEHIRRCEQGGVSVAITAGRRSVADQLWLFQRGRTLQDGVWVKTGRVVTNALPEKSPHCPHIDANGRVGGAAYDLAILVNNKPVFEEEHKLADGQIVRAPHPAYMEVVGPQGEAIGLVWGHRFHSIDDLDHFELPGWRAMPLGHGIDGRSNRHGLTD